MLVLAVKCSIGTALVECSVFYIILITEVVYNSLMKYFSFLHAICRGVTDQSL